MLAYLGSANYFDRRQFGPIDMVGAIRSPGSALKPFIYGMAFDELVVHPETIMIDQPMRFGEWAPENFDHLFRGEISAREALQLSLNLPAVTLMDAIGAPPFRAETRGCGLSTAFAKGSWASGPADRTWWCRCVAEEMVSLCTPRFQSRERLVGTLPQGSARREAKPLIGPLGSYYVTRILEDTPPPASWLASANRRQASRIAYKTGTSCGYRDAWAIGYTRDYTIGIWVGRPDGSFSGGRMGRDAAAPCFSKPLTSCRRATARCPACRRKGHCWSATWAFQPI